MGIIDIRTLIYEAINAWREGHNGEFPRRVQVSSIYRDELENTSTYYWAGSHLVELDYIDGIEDKKGVRCIP